MSLPMAKSFTARRVHSTACDTRQMQIVERNLGTDLPSNKKNDFLQMEKPGSQVGATRFERATSCSQIGLGRVTLFVGFAVKHRKALVFPA